MEPRLSDLLDFLNPLHNREFAIRHLIQFNAVDRFIQRCIAVNVCDVVAGM